MNPWMNPRARCRSAPSPCQQLRELRDVLVEVRRQVQQPALDVLQMLEVQRAFLRRGELLGTSIV